MSFSQFEAEPGNEDRTGQLVRKAGLEPAWLAPPPPQDGVSANSTTSAFPDEGRGCFLFRALTEVESDWAVEQAPRDSAQEALESLRQFPVMPASPREQPLA